MASNVSGSLGDLARKAANRVETVVGDDARELSRRAKKAISSYRDDYRSFTGKSGRSKSKSASQRGGRKSSGRPA